MAAQFFAGLYPAVPNPVRAVRIALYWSHVAAADRSFMLRYTRYTRRLAEWALTRLRILPVAKLLAVLVVQLLLLVGELCACAASLALAAAASVAFVSSSIAFALVFRAPVVCGCRAAHAAAAPHRYVARAVYWAVFLVVAFVALVGFWYAVLSSLPPRWSSGITVTALWPWRR